MSYVSSYLVKAVNTKGKVRDVERRQEPIQRPSAELLVGGRVGRESSCAGGGKSPSLFTTNGNSVTLSRSESLNYKHLVVKKL